MLRISGNIQKMSLEKDDQNYLISFFYLVRVL